MDYTMPITKDMVCARTTASVSTKAATIVCRKLNRMEFGAAKKLVAAIAEGKESIRGRYHTATAEEIGRLLESLEFNAKARSIEPAKMTLLISAHQGTNMMRSRTKRMYGYHMKSTHIHAILRPAAKKAAGAEKK
ncbi:MAG: hypothetical protein QXU82_00890 [Candidatus Aenigmatarchaeota archaeon]